MKEENGHKVVNLGWGEFYLSWWNIIPAALILTPIVGIIYLIFTK